MREKEREKPTGINIGMTKSTWRLCGSLSFLFCNSRGFLFFFPDRVSAAHSSKCFIFASASLITFKPQRKKDRQRERGAVQMPSGTHKRTSACQDLDF